jgi:hypothetical protein
MRLDRRGVPWSKRGLAVALIVVGMLWPGPCPWLGRPHPALAQSPAVDVQIILAVDVSGSVNEVRFELQKQGYVAAFRSPRLWQAIQSTPSRRIAVAMVQWTGPSLQIEVVPWRLIDGEASMHAMADAVAAAPRQLFGGGTSISGAIDFAVALFARTELQGGRRVIDVSGDGPNNRGRPAVDARDDAVRAGVTINGLPILAIEPTLDQYYLYNVIGGPNAFVVAAASYETFADAILRKLVTEIASAPTVAPERRFARGNETAAGIGPAAGLVPPADRGGHIGR